MTLLCALLPLSINLAANAQSEKVLHTFLGGSDGGYPVGGVIFDAAGNLYGTTSGGANVQGTVFELSPAADGSWTETVLHTFGSGNKDNEPNGGLVFDTAGNLYGTTYIGGKSSCTGGCGTVFKISPVAGAGWTATVLYSFSVPPDGNSPEGSLVFDSMGNLYGATGGGGSYSGGTVFELQPGANGNWSKRTIHNFGAGNDGIYPYGNLVLDTAGNLYGTTGKGGAYGGGIVYELTPTSSGGWTEHLLHNFGNGEDGLGPTGGLVLDAAGNVYGTTGAGGAHQKGIVFELTPSSHGGWAERILHTFDAFPEGAYPLANLIFDSLGNLYGETLEGGIVGCVEPGCGTAFKLSPITGGGWEETVLDSFSVTTDGGRPTSPLVLDSAGNLYGTTFGGSGGVANYGTVLEITP